MKIDPYNFELYRFKLDTFFSEIQCEWCNVDLIAVSAFLLSIPVLQCNYRRNFRVVA